MSDTLLFLLLFTAIAIGWGMGRYALRKPPEEEEGELPAGYYQSLNFLINDEDDAEFDRFVETLEVTPETIDYHLAVGTLMRQRGEVERAISVHQNLLARPSLPARRRNPLHLELARDYISAGLLDRAERLLKDLLADPGETRITGESRTLALEHLLDIYQSEKDWRAAIDIAQQLRPKKTWLRAGSSSGASTLRALAHFHCELAEDAINKREYQAARTELRAALADDSNSVRASLLRGRLELASGHPQEAITALRRIAQQNPVYLAEAVPALEQAHRDLDTVPELLNWLMAQEENHPGTRLLLACVRLLREAGRDEEAMQLLAERLGKRPTLRGLANWMELDAHPDSEAASQLSLLQDALLQLVRGKPDFQCHQCGFSGDKLHWQCPGCKQWETIAAIRGLEGD